MQLALFARYGHSGISGLQRTISFRIGNGAARSDIAKVRPTNSGAALFGTQYAVLDVISDTTATHLGAPTTVNSFGAGQVLWATVMDFSQPSTVDVFLISVAETAVNITSASWVGGVATYNTSADSTLAVGDKTTIAGVSLAGYNGVIIVDSIVDTDTFTALIADPGGSGTGGTSSRISNVTSQSYVLELVG